MTSVALQAGKISFPPGCPDERMSPGTRLVPEGGERAGSDFPFASPQCRADGTDDRLNPGRSSQHTFFYDIVIGSRGRFLWMFISMAMRLRKIKNDTCTG